MPEIVEVKTIAEALSKELTGMIVTSINMSNDCVHHPDYGRKPLNTLFPFIDMLPLKISIIDARGKKIIFCLSSLDDVPKAIIVSSLGMTGFWFFEEKKHTKIVFNYIPSNISSNIPSSVPSREERKLYYDDARGFGFIHICFTQKEYTEAMKGVGHCLIAERDLITEEWWLSQFRNKKLGLDKNVAEFLLEQHRFAGIGNYLKSEILYHSNINPHRSLISLSDQEIEVIRLNTFAVIDESYKLRGYSLKDYKDPYGVEGKFDTYVYNKKMDPYGNRVEVISGERVTSWVPTLHY